MRAYCPGQPVLNGTPSEGDNLLLAVYYIDDVFIHAQCPGCREHRISCCS